jgi:vanillate O-demethylase monooxygenase subunit
LVFDAAGRCVHNPHENGAIPAAAKVPAYPVTERNGIIWIWMGDAGAADAGLVPDFRPLEEREGWAVIRSKLVVKANYEMVADNLLDLSHVRFLHPFLASGEMPAEMIHQREVSQVGDTVWHRDSSQGAPIGPLFSLLWGDRAPVEGVGDLWADMRWDPPGNLFLDTGMTALGGSRADGPTLPFAHMLTPETESTTHYFWGFSRNFRVHEPDVDALLLAGFTAAFENEDEPMIEACYELMDFNNDLMSMRPVLLPGDAAAVRARRILAARINAEAEAASRTI